jgi:hypothetical protein
MRGREALVERSQPAITGPGDLGQIGVDHLAMTDHAAKRC